MDGPQAMRRALVLARRGLGNTWPNPAVGCVLVHGARVVGEGWTQPGGRPHAETVALDEAGRGARGATAYVTLEPCAHTGKTPPCAIALAEAGVARVVIALEDPDPRVSGGGRRILQRAGIAVDEGLMTREAAELNAGFLSRVRRHRPWVTLKLASTLDGRIALASGESRWITGEAARRFAHQLRAEADAVLVGAGTARADDPMLDVRHGIDDPRPPVRIVADPRLTLPVDSRLARSARDQPVWALYGAAAPAGNAELLADLGVRPIECALEAGGALDLGAAIRRMGEEGLTRVLCEGGGKLAAELIRAGLIDELVLLTAGKVIGGDGIPNMGPLGLDRLADAPQFEIAESRVIGSDLMSRWVAPDSRAAILAPRATAARGRPRLKRA
mgnify:CR=1 FL=1